MLIISSCNQPEDHKKTDASIIQVDEVKGIVRPQETLKPPQKVLLDSMPHPPTIDVPTKTGGYHIITEKGIVTKIKLSPPITRPAIPYYFMTTFTQQDGLPINDVNVTFIDKKGNLWIGTQGLGVTRYDGKSFRTYSEGYIDPDTWAIIEDKSGNLWFGTQGGVSKYNGEQFSNFTVNEGLINNYVNSILEDQKGNLWFATEGGISKYDGKNFSNYTKDQGLLNNIIWDVHEDKNGNLWFATEGGVSKYDGKSFVNFNEEQGLVNNFVRRIEEDKTGNLWFGTEGGISKYDGKSFTNFTKQQGLVNDNVWGINVDKDNHLWFATEGGVIEYDGKVFTHYSIEEGLPDRFVKNITIDKAHNFWFGFYGSGLSRFEGKAFTNYTHSQGLTSYDVDGVLEDESGNLWFSGSKEGLTKYDGKSFTNFTTTQGLPSNNLNDIFKDKKGNIWIASDNGIANMHDGNSITSYSTDQGLVNNHVRAIAEDNDGNLWFGTYGGGASRFDGQSFTNYTYDQGLAGNYIRTIFKDKVGNLWFGTQQGGVSKFDGKNFINFKEEHGLGSNGVTGILEDAMGNFWFGTFGGLSRYDGKTFTNYSIEQGMPVDSTYVPIITKEQNILAGTDKGIAVLTGYASREKQNNSAPDNIPPQNNLTNEELKNYQPIFEIYNIKNGYPIGDANRGQHATILDSKGIIWMGTGTRKTALVRFDYAALNKDRSPPVVNIQSVKIDGQNVVWNDLIKENPPNITEETILFGNQLSDEKRERMRKKFGDLKFTAVSKWYPVPENLQLPYSHNNITFDFAAIELDRPQNVLYQYKLEGYDRNWSIPSNNSVATFGNIQEGSYQFKVKAQSPYGVWSEPITYTFKVLPPWFRTWWAYSLYAMSGISVIYLIFRWRMHILNMRYKKLQILYWTTERFVPKAFLNLLQKKNIEDIKLGDCVKKDISVLFNDIRSFTTLVEKYSPEEAFAFVNRYWRFMAPLIRQNGGYIDQYQGDAILAIFPHRPEDAVRASMAMIQALAEFNRDQAELNNMEIKMGIGISTGLAMLGVIGEEERQVSGIISDVANTASRVEGLTKVYGTPILLSGNTANVLTPQADIILRQVDRLLLKGKSTATEIFEVVGWESKLQNISLDEYLKIFSNGLEMYFQGQFFAAKQSFEQCLIHFSEDKVVDILLKRCLLYINEGPPQYWDGTFIMSSK